MLALEVETGMFNTNVDFSGCVRSGADKPVGGRVVVGLVFCGTGSTGLAIGGTAVTMGLVIGPETLTSTFGIEG